jgi:hypothetical protein
MCNDNIFILNRNHYNEGNVVFIFIFVRFISHYQIDGITCFLYFQITIKTKLLLKIKFI